MADAPEQSDRPIWKLRLTSEGDPAEGRVFPITGETFTIGRELFHDIPLDDLHISKTHARLSYEGEQLLIEDLNSVNGTLVNDAPIFEPHPLQPDDVITLGPFTFRVEGPEQPTPKLSQARVQTRVHPVGPAQRSSGRVMLLLAAIGLLLFLIAILAIGGYWLLSNRDFRPSRAELPPTETAAPRVPAIVVNQAPARTSQAKVDQSIIVQATASDPTGVTRMELWVNERQVDQVVSKLAQNVPSMTAAFQWKPETPGEYLIEIRAYNQGGLMSAVTVTNLTAVGVQNTPTPAPTAIPTATITPLPPPPSPTPTATMSPTLSPTVPLPTPRLALLAVNSPVLNVREGPGTQYGIIGQLTQGDGVEIVGQAETTRGRWWQVRTDVTATGLGWVSAEPGLGTAINTDIVPVVAALQVPTPTSTASPVDTPTPTPTATPTVPVIRAPSGKTLLIVSNRSLANLPARLTLSGGRSVGGGREIDVDPNSQVELVLEPDFYRAVWSAAYRGFARGVDFTAVPGKVMVMWIVPEDGLTGTDLYDELAVGGVGAPTATPSATPPPAVGGYVAPPGKALLVVSNRSLTNVFGLVTVSGGSFAGGEQMILNANTERVLEIAPGNYRTIWGTAGFTAGHEFRATAGEVILGWIIPENEQVFMQFPGQPPRQINN